MTATSHRPSSSRTGEGIFMPKREHWSATNDRSADVATAVELLALAHKIAGRLEYPAMVILQQSDRKAPAGAFVFVRLGPDGPCETQYLGARDLVERYYRSEGAVFVEGFGPDTDGRLRSWRCSWSMPT